jgi:hypothetical protein
MKRFGVKSDKVVIFEDSKTGILSARNTFPKYLVGMETVYSRPELLAQGVDWTISDYRELTVESILSPNNKNNNTMETLTRWIQRSLPDAQQIRIDDAKLKGGYISDVVSVVYVDRENNEHACVLKLENTNETFLSTMAHNLGLYEREYLYYSVIQPDCPPTVRSPQCHGLVLDDQGVRRGILMENLFPKGFLPNLDLSQHIHVVPVIIDRLAALHSHYWNKCAIYPDLRANDDPLFRPKWEMFVAEKWPMFRKAWENALSAEHMTLAETIVADYSNIQLALSRGDLTLCHGDVKSPNLFYEPMANGGYEPWFIDWQYICRGKGVQDLVFFLIESFDGPERSGEYKEMYYQALLAKGVVYCREDYDRDFRNAMFYFPFFVAIWFGTVAEDELIDKEFPGRFIRRLFDFYQNHLNAMP